MTMPCFRVSSLCQTAAALQTAVCCFVPGTSHDRMPPNKERQGVCVCVCVCVLLLIRMCDCCKITKFMIYRLTGNSTEII